MKRYGLIATVFLLVFLLGVGTHAVRNTPPLQDTKETEALKIVFPQADKFSPKYQTPPHYKAYNIDPQTKKEKLIGIGFLTTDIAPEIQGYSGPIEIMVGADTSVVSLTSALQLLCCRPELSGSRAVEAIRPTV